MTSPNFCDYLPFEEELVLYLHNFQIPLPKDDFVPCLIEIGLLVLGKICFST
jgi:hypothetical protein